MPTSVRMISLEPSRLLDPNGTKPEVSDFTYQFVAQGDSWFSIGAFPPWSSTNLLMQFQFDQPACAINCAHPGDELAHMVDWSSDPQFVSMIAGPLSQKWHGILLSAGGNDLISALNVTSLDGNGMLWPQASRLLLTKDEWGPAGTISRYVSQPGWDVFDQHMKTNFAALIALRDGPGSSNRGIPIFLHTYAYPTPRNAPASAMLHLGPWLYPAFLSYAIPAGDWEALAKEFINRLAALLLGLNLPAVHVADTRNVPLLPADPNSIGVSGDWENEIHPTQAGYTKLAAQWVKLILDTI